MRKQSRLFAGLVMAAIVFFGMSIIVESSAWARAGGGRSMGSRGSKSFSSPQTPSSPSQSAPGIGTPGRNPIPGSPAQPSGGFLSRSPFMQGLAGGLAGGLLGSLLFGGIGHASPGGVGGGGIGFMDLALLGLLLYLAYRFFKKRREQSAYAPAYQAGGESPHLAGSQEFRQSGYPYGSNEVPESSTGHGERESGLAQIRDYDPGFDKERFKETAQDHFFRIQAGWTNRSLHGLENLLSDQMALFFRGELDAMSRKGQINRLENIAIRKVELTEAWQEAGKDFITVLFTANLLDYTVDETTQDVIEGDRINPVKFQEFWTFSRGIGSPQWQLSAIDQMNR
jgi:predicted lipid-binding transport protein (Tim44 family)